MEVDTLGVKMNIPKGLEDVINEAVSKAFKFDKEFFSLPIISVKDVKFERFNVDASSYKEVQRLQLKLEKRLPKYGMSEEETNDAILAVLEGVQNAQQHAYNFEKGKIVRLDIMYTPYFDQYSIIFEGKPFDIETSRGYAKRAMHMHQLSKLERGRGWGIMMGLCDIVHPTTNGKSNQLLLIKFKRPGEYHGPSTAYKERKTSNMN